MDDTRSAGDGEVREGGPEPALERSVGAFAYEVLRAQYWVLRAHEPAVRLGDDPEALHRMRVALRRLRAGLVLFGEALPARASLLRDRLGRVGSLLGGLRDLDLLCARVEALNAGPDGFERDAVEPLARVLQERRARVRVRVASALDSASFRLLSDRLERFLSTAAVRRGPVARAPVRELAPEWIARAHRRAIELGDAVDDASPPDALHALRIRSKRLRYAVEFLEPVYGKAAREYAGRVADLQDVLGAHQDAVVARAALRALALERRRLPPATLLATGALLERLRVEAVEARARVPKRYRRLSAGAWRRLGRTMEALRGGDASPGAGG